MSLRVVGYDTNGRRIVVDEGPSGIGGTRHLGGTLVVGEPGPRDRERLNQYQRRHKAKKAAA